MFLLRIKIDLGTKEKLILSPPRGTCNMNLPFLGFFFGSINSKAPTPMIPRTTQKFHWLFSTLKK